MLIPLLCAAVGLLALARGSDIFSAFRNGAISGLQTLLGIFPALLMLLPMIHILRASGLLEAVTRLCSPMLSAAGIPAETAPILLLRPFSGSGALAAAADIIAAHGPDSTVGRSAAVMLGSTETTFYVLTVYFAGVKHADIKSVLPAALIADVVGFVVAAWTVRWFF